MENGAYSGAADEVFDANSASSGTWQGESFATAAALAERLLQLSMGLEQTLPAAAILTPQTFYGDDASVEDSPLASMAIDAFGMAGAEAAVPPADSRGAAGVMHQSAPTAPGPAAVEPQPTQQEWTRPDAAAGAASVSDDTFRVGIVQAFAIPTQSGQPAAAPAQSGQASAAEPSSASQANAVQSPSTGRSSGSSPRLTKKVSWADRSPGRTSSRAAWEEVWANSGSQGDGHVGKEDVTAQGQGSGNKAKRPAPSPPPRAPSPVHSPRLQSLGQGRASGSTHPSPVRHGVAVGQGTGGTHVQPVATAAPPDAPEHRNGDTLVAPPQRQAAVPPPQFRSSTPSHEGNLRALRQLQSSLDGLLASLPTGSRAGQGSRAMVPAGPTNGADGGAQGQGPTPSGLEHAMPVPQQAALADSAEGTGAATQAPQAGHAIPSPSSPSLSPPASPGERLGLSGLTTALDNLSDRLTRWGRRAGEGVARAVSNRHMGDTEGEDGTSPSPSSPSALDVSESQLSLLIHQSSALRQAMKGLEEQQAQAAKREAQALARELEAADSAGQYALATVRMRALAQQLSGVLVHVAVADSLSPPAGTLNLSHGEANGKTGSPSRVAPPSSPDQLKVQVLGRLAEMLQGMAMAGLEDGAHEGQGQEGMNGNAADSAHDAPAIVTSPDSPLALQHSSARKGRKLITHNRPGQRAGPAEGHVAYPQGIPSLPSPSVSLDSSLLSQDEPTPTGTGMGMGLDDAVVLARTLRTSGRVSVEALTAAVEGTAMPTDSAASQAGLFDGDLATAAAAHIGALQALARELGVEVGHEDEAGAEGQGQDARPSVEVATHGPTSASAAEYHGTAPLSAPSPAQGKSSPVSESSGQALGSPGRTTKAKSSPGRSPKRTTLSPPFGLVTQWTVRVPAIEAQQPQAGAAGPTNGSPSPAGSHGGTDSSASSRPSTAPSSPQMRRAEVSPGVSQAPTQDQAEVPPADLGRAAQAQASPGPAPPPSPTLAELAALPVDIDHDSRSVEQGGEAETVDQDTHGLFVQPNGGGFAVHLPAGGRGVAGHSDLDGAHTHASGARAALLTAEQSPSAAHRALPPVPSVGPGAVIAPGTGAAMLQALLGSGVLPKAVSIQAVQPLAKDQAASPTAAARTGISVGPPSATNPRSLPDMSVRPSPSKRLAKPAPPLMARGGDRDPYGLLAKEKLRTREGLRQR